MRRFVVTVLLSCTTITLAAQFRIPRVPLPKDLPLPNIDRVLHGSSPISTTLKDAHVEVPFLDRMEVRFGDLASLRNERGTFTLQPGHWATDLQSFCYRAGTRGPQRTDGQGYLSAGISGPDSGLFVDMLSKYATLRDVEQRDMQVLIWAILARTKIHSLEPRLQALAVRVLTPAQIAALDTGALDVIPMNLRQRAFGSLPPEIRAIADAENRIRDILYRANYAYDELESIAVLQGPEPRANRPIPRTRWSIHPGGYLIRYHPTGYQRTTVEIARPPKFTIHRDAKGRITSVEWSDGRRTETEYDDSIPAFTPAPNLPVVAYAFKSIKMIRPRANGRPEEITLRNMGWTFVMRQDAKVAAVPHFGFRLASWMQEILPSRIIAWKERYDHFNSEYRERAEWYRDRYEHMTSPPPSVEQVIHDISDMEHYRAGIEAALTGDVGDQLGWLIDHQERMNAALERATLEIANLDASSDDGTYVPGTDLAVPAHTASQRLGVSGRGFF
jgi:hypothetical protein